MDKIGRCKVLHILSFESLQLFFFFVSKWNKIWIAANFMLFPVIERFAGSGL